MGEINIGSIPFDDGSEDFAIAGLSEKTRVFWYDQDSFLNNPRGYYSTPSLKTGPFNPLNLHESFPAHLLVYNIIRKGETEEKQIEILDLPTKGIAGIDFSHYSFGPFSSLNFNLNEFQLSSYTFPISFFRLVL